MSEPGEPRNSMSGQVEDGLVVQTGDIGGSLSIGKSIKWWTVVATSLAAGLAAIAVVWWPIAPGITRMVPPSSSPPSTQPPGGTLSVTTTVDTNCAYRFAGPGSPDASEGLAGRATILLSAQNPRDEEVLITGIRVVVRHRSGVPLEGRLKPSGCSWGPIAVRPMIVDLESEQPRAMADDDPTRGGAFSESPPTEFPFTVSRGNPEIFELRFRTRACDCTFDLKVDWVAAGKNNEAVLGPYRFVPVVDALISR